MNRQQLEMNLDSSVAFRPSTGRQRRLTRARWWFAQMRQVVDNAWEPTPSAETEPACPSIANAPVRN
jgi:hypothetical protein